MYIKIFPIIETNQQHPLSFLVPPCPFDYGLCLLKTLLDSFLYSLPIFIPRFFIIKYNKLKQKQ